MKKFLALLLALVMVLALVACGTTETADDTAADDAAAAEDTAEADTAEEADAAEEEDTAAAPADGEFDWSAYEGAEIEIMWQETDDTQIDICENFAMPAVQEIADEYGFNVTWVGNVDSNYTTLAATGELADIWFGNVTLEMIQSDIMLDLTPYLTADTYLEDNFLTPSFYYFNGKIWSLSSGVDSFYNGVLYYNKAIFEECGVAEEDIATYDGLLEACKKIADKGYTAFAFDGTNNSVYTRFMWQNTVISEDVDAYKALLDGDKTALENEAFAKAFQDVNDMINAGYCGSAVNTKETADTMATFAAGEAAMLYIDSWNNGGVMDGVAGAFEIGVAWWPTNNDSYATGDYIAGWGSPLSGWCAKADTEYPELVVELIKVINKAEAARHLNAGLGTNHFQDGTPTPANEIEEARIALRDNVKEFLKGWEQNTVDNATLTVMKENMSTNCSEDSIVCADLVATMSEAWQDNTFFG